MPIVINRKDNPDENERRQMVEKALGLMSEKEKMAIMGLADDPLRHFGADLDQITKLAKAATEDCQANFNMLANAAKPMAEELRLSAEAMRIAIHGTEADRLSREAKMAELTFRPKFMDDIFNTSQMLHDVNESARQAGEAMRREKDKAGRFMDTIKQMKAEAERELKTDEELVMYCIVGGEKLPISKIEQIDFDHVKITFSTGDYIVTGSPHAGFKTVKKYQTDSSANPGGGGYL